MFCLVSTVLAPGGDVLLHSSQSFCFASFFLSLVRRWFLLSCDGKPSTSNNKTFASLEVIYPDDDLQMIDNSRFRLQERLMVIIRAQHRSNSRSLSLLRAPTSKSYRHLIINIELHDRVQISICARYTHTHVLSTNLVLSIKCERRVQVIKKRKIIKSEEELSRCLGKRNLTSREMMKFDSRVTLQCSSTKDT